MTEELEKKGCPVIKASGDADVDIVKAAVKASEPQSTTSLFLVLQLFLLVPAGRARLSPNKQRKVK